MDQATRHSRHDLRPKAKGEPFALATVVRTVAVTAAKAGAKAVILPDGTISEGGSAAAAPAPPSQGGARSAGRRPAASGFGAAARRAAGARHPGRGGARRRAVRREYVPEPGHHGHVRRAGAATAGNRRLRLVTGCGRGRRFGDTDWLCRDGLRARAGAGGLPGGRPPHRRLCACRSSARPRASSWCRRRAAATRPRSGGACSRVCDYVAFVGSRRKAEALGSSRRRHRARAPCELKAPAGLDLGAITPDEIALSILAEIVAVRRAGCARDVAASS